MEVEHRRPATQTTEAQRQRCVKRKVRIDDVCAMRVLLACSPEPPQALRERGGGMTHNPHRRWGIASWSHYNATRVWYGFEERAVIPIEPADRVRKPTLAEHQRTGPQGFGRRFSIGVRQQCRASAFD